MEMPNKGGYLVVRAHPLVAEAAVVGRPHEIKGEAICAFVTLKGPRPTGVDAEKLAKSLRDCVESSATGGWRED